MVRAVVGLLFAALGFSTAAQTYPARTVRIVVPFAVGGPADIYGRFIGAKLLRWMAQGPRAAMAARCCGVP